MKKLSENHDGSNLVNPSLFFSFNRTAQQFTLLLCIFALTSTLLLFHSVVYNVIEAPLVTKDIIEFKKAPDVPLISENTYQHPTWNLNISCDLDQHCSEWKRKLMTKLECIKDHCGLYFYYHMRKAAGTTITQILQLNSARLNTVKFLPAEGLPLDHRFLNQQGIITHVSFRDPVDRIISLYWYEHVLYYHQVQKKPGKASNLRTWVNHWRDSSLWKQNYTRINPATVYIDIENYYIKALTEWDGIKNITRDDLERAKSVVDQFDIVIVSEMFNLQAQHALLDISVVSVGFEPGKFNYKYLSTDKNMIRQYQSSLASDEAEIRAMLREINQLDYELLEYAKQVMSRQVATLLPITRTFEQENIKHGEWFMRVRNFTTAALVVNRQSALEKHRSKTFGKSYLEAFEDIRLCTHKPQCSPNISIEMYNASGVHRPFLHKTPVNVSYIEPPSRPPILALTSNRGVNNHNGASGRTSVYPPWDRNDIDSSDTESSQNTLLRWNAIKSDPRFADIIKRHEELLKSQMRSSA